MALFLHSIGLGYQKLESFDHYRFYMINFRGAVLGCHALHGNTEDRKYVYQIRS